MRAFGHKTVVVRVILVKRFVFRTVELQHPRNGVTAVDHGAVGGSGRSDVPLTDAGDGCEFLKSRNEFAAVGAGFEPEVNVVNEHFLEGESVRDVSG